MRNDCCQEFDWTCPLLVELSVPGDGLQDPGAIKHSKFRADDLGPWTSANIIISGTALPEFFSFLKLLFPGPGMPSRPWTSNIVISGFCSCGCVINESCSTPRN